MRRLIFMKKLMKDTMEFDEGIKKIARKLSRGNSLLAEELRNEMHITLLKMEAGREKPYYYRAAKNGAISYLKSRAFEYSYCGNVKHISLEAMEEAGFQIDTEGRVHAPEKDSSAYIEESDDPDQDSE